MPIVQTRDPLFSAKHQKCWTRSGIIVIDHDKREGMDRRVIVIIDHSAFSFNHDEDVFENRLTLEIRLLLTSEGTVLSGNTNGRRLVERYGSSFSRFFGEDNRQLARHFLKRITEHKGTEISAFLREADGQAGDGLFFKAIYKKGYIWMVGYDERLIAYANAEFIHELRNPLTVIRGFVQLSMFTKQFDKYYVGILSEIDHMRDTLEHFLSLARGENNKKSMKPEDIAEQFIPVLSTECQLHNIDFNYDISDSKRTCRADVNKIRQVAVNLLRNAVEAIETGQGCRKLIFHGKCGEEGYSFAFIDSGTGMPPEVIRKIGEPYYTTKEHGTGVGLWVCKRIISEHCGTFCLTSVPGHGTTASFTLPYES
ncbi:MAG: HAMP domain-containing sensor histidine kinase [Sporolactobacillus sp.]